MGENNPFSCFEYDWLCWQYLLKPFCVLVCDERQFLTHNFGISTCILFYVSVMQLFVFWLFDILELNATGCSNDVLAPCKCEYAGCLAGCGTSCNIGIFVDTIYTVLTQWQYIKYSSSYQVGWSWLNFNKTQGHSSAKQWKLKVVFLSSHPINLTSSA